MSYQKKGGRGPARPSVFWYDNDSGHKGPFHITQIPEEKHRRLRKLLRMYHSEPVPLKDLSCRIVRKKLGKHLTEKVEFLPIPPDIRDVILLQDLFQSPESEGSFEV